MSAVKAVRSCGAIKPSFAYDSISERWPRILTKIVDQMHQHHGKAVNEFGQLGEGNVTWYKAPWLFTECFMYRTIYLLYQETKHFKSYDPFRIEKEKSYFDSLAHLLALGTELVDLSKKSIGADELKTAISRHLQISLWGNKADLSLSGGDPHFMSDTLFRELTELRPNILVDQIDASCDFLMKLDKDRQVDIILDNSGLELFTDLCLADILISNNCASKVVFHGKAFPWYVSDVTLNDMEWVVRQTAENNDSYLKELGNKWSQFFTDKKFEYSTHDFYTYGVPYSAMKTRSPDLYDKLSKSSFLIFKGDLNGRKLIGDRDWTPTTPYKTVLDGFEPTKFLSLRTLKAETVAGLSTEAYESILKKFGTKDRSWQVSSDYAVAQALL